MTITYSVHGWNENGNNIIVIVDIDDDEVALGMQFERAKEIAGPKSWFGGSTRLNAQEAALVPADCKGIPIITAELYARAPELDANYRLRRARPRRAAKSNET